MNPTASAHHVSKLPQSVRDNIREVLWTCDDIGMSVRVESVGNEVYVVCGSGFSAPMYWINKYGFNNP